MNIFKVLSQGKGRLNEENLSAILGFLLSPTENHGLGDIFLRHFIENLACEILSGTNWFSNVLDTKRIIDAEVFFEVPYEVTSGAKKKRIIDIEIRIYSPYSLGNSEKKEIHRIGIENKTRIQSNNDPDQLKEEFEGIKMDLGDDDVSITMVFLTPDGKPKALVETYEKLTDEILGTSKKVWVRWYEQRRGEIIQIIKIILEKEENCEIEPISEYVRHTLKALVRHILENFKLSGPDIPFDVGEVVENKKIELSLGKYELKRYTSGSIKVFNLETGDEEPARTILRKIDQEMGLNMLTHSSGLEKNTRTLGKDIIGFLNQKKQN